MRAWCSWCIPPKFRTIITTSKWCNVVHVTKQQKTLGATTKTCTIGAFGAKLKKHCVLIH